MSAEGRAALAGVVAAGSGLGVGEVVSAFGQPGQSLVGGVGNEIVDRAAGGTVRFAIDTLGTANKPALVGGIVLICLALGAAVGRASLRRGWIGPLAFGAAAAVGVVAGVRDPLADSTVVVVAAVLAALAGIATLRVLLPLVEPAPRRSGWLPVATTGTVTATIERPDNPTAPRRAFFAWAGAAGAFAVAAAGGARALRGRSNVEAARAAVDLPAVAGTTRGASDLAIDGLSPYITPNDRFYRIDTALVVPQVDPAGWKLAITGLVERPFELTFDDLLALPMVERTVTLACVSNEVGGNLVGNAVWQGVPLDALLERAGIRPDASQIVGRSVDGFTAGFPTEVALDGRTALVAVGMNGEPLPVRHGFPARLVVAGLYGYVSATKWLTEIELTTWEGFDGYWIPRGWAKEGPVKTQSRIDVPRAGAELPTGATPVAGVAWSPIEGIRGVEIRVDEDGWRPARLVETTSDETWVQWVAEWDATPGEHTIRVRATDADGETQTERVSSVAPDGATGWHRRRVTVVEAAG
jgi:DMSO/TMAO reductase YedYZ molybdopterin-dependent catalytic subunit